jgi:SAM-dependent methyltransferase
MNTWIFDLLRCPECRSGDLIRMVENIACNNCKSEFVSKSGAPVLIRKDNDIFPAREYKSDNSIATTALNYKKIYRFIPQISVNLSREKCLKSFGSYLKASTPANVLVVGSGAQRNVLNNDFAEFPNVRIAYCDVDKSAAVDCYCDTHELPFVDGCFDGVIITAVLMHVLYPEHVVSEIVRILKPQGVIYSELGFMQQVIEGGYDFTRYSLSGHRRLLNHFEEIESGMVAGPATALVWSIENFILAFIRISQVRFIAKALIRTTLFWIKYCDYVLCRQSQAMDGASCTYFLGKKSTTIVPDKQIIERYIGGKHLSHL